MTLTIDSVLKDTAALAGASVPDNANDYQLMYNATTDFMPYADYIKIEVNGVEVLNYDPNEIIVGTALPNRANPGTADGIFTWGTNPVGVLTTLGSMSSSSQPSIGGTSDTSTSDILSPTGGTDWRPDTSVSAKLLANPMRPIVTAVSDNTTLSEYQVWVWYGLIFVVFITALVGANVRGHHTITGLGTGAAMVLMIVWTVFPPWVIPVVVLVIWLGHVSERSPSL